MLRKAFPLFALLILIPSLALSETVNVQFQGVDDGVKTTKQQDYKEAVLFAKKKAIERAGVKVKALTNAKDFVVQSDYIESKAEKVLLPGYYIIDCGYQLSGRYVVILVGKMEELVWEPWIDDIIDDVPIIKIDRSREKFLFGPGNLHD